MAGDYHSEEHERGEWVCLDERQAWELQPRRRVRIAAYEEAAAWSGPVWSWPLLGRSAKAGPRRAGVGLLPRETRPPARPRATHRQLDAAFALDPDGITCTKTPRPERRARKLADALPGGHGPLGALVWKFLRPMASPRLAALHRDAFYSTTRVESSVEIAARRAESDLADLDLGDDTEPAAA